MNRNDTHYHESGSCLKGSFSCLATASLGASSFGLLFRISHLAIIKDDLNGLYGHSRSINFVWSFSTVGRLGDQNKIDDE